MYGSFSSASFVFFSVSSVPFFQPIAPPLMIVYQWVTFSSGLPGIFSASLVSSFSKTGRNSLFLVLASTPSTALPLNWMIRLLGATFCRAAGADVASSAASAGRESRAVRHVRIGNHLRGESRTLSPLSSVLGGEGLGVRGKTQPSPLTPGPSPRKRGRGEQDILHGFDLVRRPVRAVFVGRDAVARR